MSLSGWMPNRNRANDIAIGGLLVLLFLLLMHFQKGILSLAPPDIPSYGGKVFVQVSVNRSGDSVYGFDRQPDLRSLLAQAGFHPDPPLPEEKLEVVYASGAKVDIVTDGERTHILEGQMSGFYKITLGVPISLNRESLDGLTAVPGIGRKLAETIVRERTKRGGFRRLDEVLSIQGFGPKLYRRISPYLGL